MNLTGIAFITCVNDEEMYKECIKFIDNLIVPEGFCIRKIAIRNAKSMASGYNEAMENNDCKYKVYLHQDTLIINRNFIIDFTKEFDDDNSIGMLGVIGTEKLLSDGVWWHGTKCFGKLYQSGSGIMLLDNHDTDELLTRQVQAIDGLIMITQYDVKWKEDIFDGWHFYDISQCIEFYKAGYRVCIPKQTTPWCIHACSIPQIDDKYQIYRNRFLEYYSKDIFPLVSILIPTYNRPQYLKIALDSAVNQTYRNIEIIIGDNSEDDATQKLVNENYTNKYRNIIYINNGGNIGAKRNFENLIDKMSGKYLNVLMDDDFLSHSKIERMIEYFIKNDDVTLVTSYRKLIDSDGNELPDCTFNRCLSKRDVIIHGNEVGREILMSLTNFIGEPSTVLIKADVLKYNGEYGIYNGKKYVVNSDVATWLNCCYLGKIIYIAEPLSFFRQHDGQDQKNIQTQIIGAKELYEMVKDSYINGYFINNKEDYISCLRLWLKKSNLIINGIKQYGKIEYEKELVRIIEIVRSEINNNTIQL